MSSCRTIKAQKGNHQDVQTKRCRQSVACKKPLKSMKLESIEVDYSIFISDSLYSYYKRLWSKCDTFWANKYIHAFWVLNVSVKIKVRENSKPNTICHITDLENFFRGNKLLYNVKPESSDYLPTHCALKVCLSLIVVSVINSAIVKKLGKKNVVPLDFGQLSYSLIGHG